MKIYLIGAGCGDMGTMTQEAVRKLGEADLIIGAARLVLGLPKAYAGKCIAAHRPDIIAEILRDRGDPEVVILLSGDSGCYSGAARLVKMIDGLNEEAATQAGTPCLRSGDANPSLPYEGEILPGISSLQYFAAKIGRPWQDMRLISAHGHDCDVAYEVMQGRDVFFLTGGRYTPAQIADDLCRAGLGALSMTVGENLSYVDERITRGRAEDFAGKTCAAMSVALVQAAPSYDGPLRGIPDEAFVRGNVPMTKMEVRAVTLAKMGVAPTDIVWDIGAGTGSVSVELSRMARRVYAVECLAEACDLIRQNRVRFCAWNVDIVPGTAPDILAGLPAPDRVFIGGSRGRLASIIGAAVSRNPDVRICLNAVTLETLEEACRVLTEIGRKPECTLLQVSRAEETGRVHMMRAQNPVYVIRG